MNRSTNTSAALFRSRRIGMLFLLVTGGLLFATSVGLAPFSALQSSASQPVSVTSDTLRVGDLERSYLYYLSPQLALVPALVFVFHGGGIDAQQMRAITAFEIERLADEHGFIVVYPNGFEKSWNGCRARAPYPANTQNIDDPGFVRALIRRFRAEFGVDSRRVFAMGFSNGGHLAYRLALEMPGEISAVAAIGASLPAAEACDCVFSQTPVAVMIVNGTEDRINPFDGGEVILPGGANLPGTFIL